MANNSYDLGIIEIQGNGIFVDKTISKTFEELTQNDLIILVEGEKDCKILIEQGIDKNRIVKVAEVPEHELYEKLHEIGAHHVINFLDYDTAGRNKAKKLTKLLSDIRLDESYRNRIFKIMNVTSLEEVWNVFRKQV